jgi:aspartyl-tRNA(Asn)/glutamyl-tRNA(Gln) amidotransferase subunit A
MDITHLSLSEAAAQIQAGDLSPVELTKACLARIERLDGRLNCFITLTASQALEAARQAAVEIRQGKWRGPLHGIPFGLKDLFETEGIRTTAGSLFFAENIPTEDAYVVQKLKRAGAVILGKLNLHEIALGVTNENPHYGTCRNPWDERRITGGSSGGSAAALAAGFCLGALGSDTGGSIRIPSSLCGTVGLKPTYGRVSLRGVIPLSWNLDHAGPMARRVRDAALILQAIAGYDEADPSSIDHPVDDYTRYIEAGVSGWQVILAAGEYFEQADDEVRKAVQGAAEVFRGLGAQVSEVELPEVRLAAQSNGLMTTSDAASFHQERMEAEPEKFGADVLERLKMGAAYTSGEYARARRTQAVLRRVYERFFSEWDILLCPATPTTAPLIGAQDAVSRARQLTRFTAPFNFTGLPALVLPCGFSAEGLPLGLQIIARPWAESTILRAGFAYERATGWHERRPQA